VRWYPGGLGPDETEDPGKHGTREPRRGASSAPRVPRAHRARTSCASGPPPWRETAPSRGFSRVARSASFPRLKPSRFAVQTRPREQFLSVVTVEKGLQGVGVAHPPYNANACPPLQPSRNVLAPRRFLDRGEAPRTPAGRKGSPPRRRIAILAVGAPGHSNKLRGPRILLEAKSLAATQAYAAEILDGPSRLGVGPAEAHERSDAGIETKVDAGAWCGRS
jgi:hypothetical protein